MVLIKVLLLQMFNIYAFANPLHPDIFPGCRKMEAEVVHIVANLFYGGLECCGTVSIDACPIKF